MKSSRRTSMTRRLLEDALIELLQEKPINKISVTELCERADVNRTTFYTHYTDVFELLSQIEEDIFKRTPEIVITGQSMEPEYVRNTFSAFARYIRDHKKVFKALLAQSTTIFFLERWSDRLVEKYRQVISDSPSKFYMFTYAISGVFGLLRRWISDDFIVSEHELANIIVQLMFNPTEVYCDFNANK